MKAHLVSLAVMASTALGAEIDWYLKPKFEDALPFDSEKKMAAVKFRGKWGYIDPKGSGKISPQFDHASSFHEDRAVVEINGKWRHIDRSGQFIGGEYDAVSSFMEKVAVARKGNLVGSIDWNGKWIHKEEVKDVSRFKGRLPIHVAHGWMVSRIHRTAIILGSDGKSRGRMIWPWVNSLSEEGIICGRSSEWKNRHFVIQNQTGIVFDSEKFLETPTAKKLKIKMLQAGYFSEGMLRITGRRKPGWYSVLGYLDGNYEPPFKFRSDNGRHWERYFQEGLAPYSKKAAGPRGFLKKDGSVAIEAQFQAVISPFSSHGFAVVQKDNKLLSIDQSGYTLGTFPADSSVFIKAAKDFSHHVDVRGDWVWINRARYEKRGKISHARILISTPESSVHDKTGKKLPLPDGLREIGLQWINGLRLIQFENPAKPTEEERFPRPFQALINKDFQVVYGPVKWKGLNYHRRSLTDPTVQPPTNGNLEPKTHTRIGLIEHCLMTKTPCPTFDPKSGKVGYARLPQGK